ncbi:MAG: adenosylcobalamin-dependent ribonucleoside-diphosphate reductase [Phycisphaerales bacterium]|nr:adenosylcobalamin-dependent ribonucleoside-diphosphate reductase [Planctomycetota bacterium]MCH8507244.1 adenosylcobalamin-dependent ribonucleoside-diphosphate reductase [Phycisphaerales bacterium]
MKITRRFTMEGQNPFSSVEWTTRSSKISNPDGSVVFEMKDAEVPSTWSQLATDIMVSKYFRKAGVPQMEQPFALPGEGKNATDADGTVAKGPERSARQVIHRLVGCWRHWGETHGYFDTPEDAQAFYDELVYMMVHQMCAPNSPQWFNTGLNFAYGISGPAQGHWIVDAETGEPRLADDAYTHPQPHACFIQSVSDDLVNDGGIMDLWLREARLFKYGSGTGTNFSGLRAENESLSGGGKSSGLMSWLKIGDRAAGAIKSGGTTRRAAKMVCLDMDHPDIASFINWKVREEIKVAALVEGLKAIKNEKASKSDPESIGETAARLGLKLDYDFNGESYQTVSGQNSNNSVRIPDAFFDAVDADADWTTTHRTTGKVAKTYKARALWDDIAYAAWRCADPGVQYDTTINAWHTCPGAGRINASNPCSEYMFLDNTACNLASLNVLKFYDPQTREFDIERYEHGVDLWTMVLEISVLMAAFPSREIAELSYKYRTLGLGYANLGAMLMQAGIPYDSDEGRAICACLSAVLTGRSYRMSALMAKEHGAFPGYGPEKDSMLRVIRNHRRAALGVDRDSGEYEDLRIAPVPIDHDLIRDRKVPLGNAMELLQHSVDAWDDALELGEKHGFRNAQTTVIAPTGTIGLLMDCDTTGVEPDFALVKFKKLAGGGYFKIANASVRPALAALGYTPDQVDDIIRHLLGTLNLHVPMPAGVDDTEGVSFHEWLGEKGLTDEDLEKITTALPGVFELGFAFNAWGLGDETLQRLGFDPEQAKADPGFSLLRRLGLNGSQIEELNRLICGTQTVEGAPHLRDEHLPVFDCANTCGKTGKRFIEVGGHIRMMAAAQPFISGAISKTINLPHDATVEDIKESYRASWELGLKANALYRDGCKLSQPLNVKSDADIEEENGEDDADALALAEVEDDLGELVGAVSGGNVRVVVKKEVEIIHRPMRRRLPETRRSITHKFNIAGHEGYLTVGIYEDGMPGELFITMAKEGSTIGGLMDSLGTATSVALQYGVPLESLVKKFTHQRFEPAGMTTNRDIPFAKSLVDYIFRWLGMEFIPGYREANAPKRPGDDKPEKAEMLAGERRIATGNARHIVAESEAEMKPRGGGNARERVHAGEQTLIVQRSHTATQSSTLSVALESAGDAPPCDVCGTITVRSGTCYKCLNCGNSMGCS